MKKHAVSPPASFEELVNHPDFVGGDVEINVDEKTTFRGPLDKMTLEGTMITFHSSWMARRKVKGNGQIEWHRCPVEPCYANTLIHHPHIGTLTGGTVVINQSSRETPMREIILYPRYGLKIKPESVIG